MSVARPTPVSHIRYGIPMPQLQSFQAVCSISVQTSTSSTSLKTSAKNERYTIFYGQLNGENDDEPADLGTEFNTPLAPIGELENASLSRLRVFLWQSHQGLNLNVVKTMIKSLESSKALVYLVLLPIFPLRLQAVDSLEGQRSAPEHPQRRSASLADKERGTPDL